MEVEVPENVVSKEIEAAFSVIQKETKIDGFRHGKAPIEVVKRKFGAEAKNKAVESSIRKTVFNALSKESFTPLDLPVIDEFDYEQGQDLKYRFTAEAHPKFEPADYKNIPLKKEVFKITDAVLLHSLDILRERNAKLVPSKTSVVSDKSLVLADYDVFDAGGKILADISAEGAMFDLGSENTLKGFKDVLIGAKAGEEKEACIEYPAAYPNKVLAGKNVKFRIKVNEVKEKDIPELTDDFAKDMGTESVNDLKAKLKESIGAEEIHRENTDIEKQIVDYLLEKNKFEVPVSLIERRKEVLIEKMEKYMHSRGVSAEYIEKQVHDQNANFKTEAEKDVRLSYILNAVSVKENLLATDEDIKVKKDEMKASNPGRESYVDKYFDERKENIVSALKEEKIFGFLIKNAKITVEEKDMPLKED
jgi:trigger factor